METRLDKDLAFVIRNPNSSQVMFSKIGKGLNIRFLNSTISALDSPPNLHLFKSTPADINNKPKKKKRNFQLQRPDVPPVGHYTVKYEGIDSHIPQYVIRRHKRKHSKEQFKHTNRSLQSTQMLQTSYCDNLKQTKCSVNMDRMLNRDQAVTQTRYSYQNPHHKRFESRPECRQSSNFKPAKGLPFNQHSFQRFPYVKMQQTNCSYFPNFEYIKRPLNIGVTKFQLRSGRKQPQIQEIPSSQFQYDQVKYASSVFAKSAYNQSKDLSIRQVHQSRLAAPKADSLFHAASLGQQDVHRTVRRAESALEQLQHRPIPDKQVIVKMNYLNFLNCFTDVSQSKKKKKKDKGVSQVITLLKNINSFTSSLIGTGFKKAQCQDTFCVLENQEHRLFFLAVYDGHGSSGRQASQTVNDSFQSQFQKLSQLNAVGQLNNDYKKIDFLRKVFKITQEKLQSSGIDYSNSGTCAIVVYIQAGKLFIANLGDSRAVLFRMSSKEKSAIELSYDHKPCRQDQRQRIEKYGGKIYKMSVQGQSCGPYRVWSDQEGPGIGMTRSLGDMDSKRIGIISLPEIQTLQLDKSDKFIVVASDGVWDVMTSAQVCGFLLKQERSHSAENLVNECKRRWQQQMRLKKGNFKIGDQPFVKQGRDDITAIEKEIQQN